MMLNICNNKPTGVVNNNVALGAGDSKKIIQPTPSKTKKDYDNYVSRVNKFAECVQKKSDEDSISKDSNATGVKKAFIEYEKVKHDMGPVGRKIKKIKLLAKVCEDFIHEAIHFEMKKIDRKIDREVNKIDRKIDRKEKIIHKKEQRKVKHIKHMLAWDINKSKCKWLDKEFEKVVNFIFLHMMENWQQDVSKAKNWYNNGGNFILKFLKNEYGPQAEAFWKNDVVPAKQNNQILSVIWVHMWGVLQPTLNAPAFTLDNLQSLLSQYTNMYPDSVMLKEINNTVNNYADYCADHYSLKPSWQSFKNWILMNNPLVAKWSHSWKAFHAQYPHLTFFDWLVECANENKGSQAKLALFRYETKKHDKIAEKAKTFIAKHA